MVRNLLVCCIALLFSCKTKEEKIQTRLKEVNKEVVILMLDYQAKRPNAESLSIDRAVNRDELFSFTNKVDLLKREKDSLQKVVSILEQKNEGL